MAAPVAALSVSLRKVKEQAAGTALECDPSSKAGDTTQVWAARPAPRPRWLSKHYHM